MGKDHTLKTLELYYESMLALMPGNVYWKDNHGVLQGCNNNLAKLLNLPFCKAIGGKTDEDIASKEEAIGIKQRDFEVMKSGVEQTNEEIYTLPDGSVITYLTQRSPIFNQKMEVVGLIGISFDISDRKKMEEELFLAKEKAEAANKAKSDFISNMEHDLRTPFAGIGGVAGLLDSMYADSYPELKDLFKILVQSCTQWENIHNQIFDVIETQQTLKIEHFYLQDELDKIRDLMQATSHINNIEFIVQYPPREETGQIETDRLIVSLIISNLVGNAFNFTEKGCITVKATRYEQSFVIETIDTGIGIATDKLDYIFEKFAKLSRSNTYGNVFKGMGLGLYRAREDAGKIKGTISVKSELGKGSTFSVVLPLSYYSSK